VSWHEGIRGRQLMRRATLAWFPSVNENDLDVHDAALAARTIASGNPTNTPGSTAMNQCHGPTRHHRTCIGHSGVPKPLTVRPWGLVELATGAVCSAANTQSVH
jgi:hypothetical protein